MAHPNMFIEPGAHEGGSHRIDGSKVRFWALKRDAKEAARTLGWPVNRVVAVHTRFCAGWALAGGPDQGLLTREGFAYLYHQANLE